MTKKEREIRNLQILDYIAQPGNTLFQAAISFKLSLNQVFLIKRKNIQIYEEFKKKYDQLQPV